MTEAEASVDRLLGGRVSIVQPEGGFRAAIDPILLAAAVPAGNSDGVLDVGSGTGAAVLALAARIPGVRVTGLEADAGLVELARESARLSGLAERTAFVAGDLLDPPLSLARGSFDHVMANPPHIAAGRGNPPPDAAKRQATVEGRAGLADWLAFMLEMARPGGTVTLIHRFERADEVARGLSLGAGDVVIFPLWPKRAGRGAKRVLVQARLGSPAGVRRTDGLVLHAAGGGYTAEADAALREGAALSLAGA